MNRDQDKAQAQSIIAQYQASMTSVIIRAGDINNDPHYDAAPGDEKIVQSLKFGDVKATIESVEVTEFGSIARTEWIKANYRPAESGLAFFQDMDPDLQPTDKATIITLDLNSLRYVPRTPAFTSSAARTGYRPQ